MLHAVSEEYEMSKIAGLLSWRHLLRIEIVQCALGIKFKKNSTLNCVNIKYLYNNQSINIQI